MIFQMHEKHGKHIAYTPMEAEANRKRGWKDIPKDSFYATKGKSESAEAVEKNVESSTGVVQTVTTIPKKLGRPRLNANPA